MRAGNELQVKLLSLRGCQHPSGTQAVGEPLQRQCIHLEHQRPGLLRSQSCNTSVDQSCKIAHVCCGADRLWSNPSRSLSSQVRHVGSLSEPLLHPSCCNLHHLCCLAVRTAKFVARKQWVVCGADDMYIRVYNYNTMDKLKHFEAHTDYIRYSMQTV